MSKNDYIDYDLKFRAKKLYVFGLAFLDILKLIHAINDVTPTWKFCGFISNSTDNLAISNSYPIVTESEVLELVRKNKDIYIVNNSNLNYRQLSKSFQNLIYHGCKLCNLIHPTVDMNRVKIGNGCIIPAGCIIGGNAKIGDFVICDYKTLISHDVTIDDNVLIGPGACIGGDAHIKKGSVIGIGAIVMGKLTINEGSIVGAGAVVTKDVEPNTVVVGIPAKPIKRTQYE